VTPPKHRPRAPLLVIDCEEMLHLDTTAAAVSTSLSRHYRFDTARLAVEAVSGEPARTGGG
jgi:hypothetical protein